MTNSHPSLYLTEAYEPPTFESPVELHLHIDRDNHYIFDKIAELQRRGINVHIHGHGAGVSDALAFVERHTRDSSFCSDSRND